MSEAVPPVVLIVEDDAAVRLFLQKAVARCGFVTLVAATVREAREAVLSGARLQCALLDKNLPDGSGLDLLALIKKEQPHAEVIIVTGYVNSQSAIEALRLGASDYICKPFDFETIQHRLKVVIERGRAVEEHARLEAMLVHSERLSSLGTMAAGVVHEINNPLSFVTTNLGFLEEELAELRADPRRDPTARLEACLEAVRESQEGLSRVATIVKDLRMFSRKDDAAPEVVSLERCLDSAVAVAGPSLRGVARLEKHYGASPLVRCSLTRLEQVFLNLIVNAAHAIRATGRGDGLIIASLLGTSAGEAVVEIADNGSGMSKQVQQRLFEPFFTTKSRDEGTGLGLSVCHGIIHGAGGRIEVSSELLVGTVFRVALPGVPAQAPPQERVA